jgi:hypothetical protein
VAVLSTWYLNWIYSSVCRTPFWTHIYDTLVDTYSDLFEQWESIPPGIQRKIIAIYIDRIDAINDWDRKAPAVTRWNPEMVIDDENV